MDIMERINKQSIAMLARGSQEKWGDPIANRKRLIPYGFSLIDKALYGIDPVGEFIVVQGQEKGRKSTIVLNFVKNIFQWEKLETKPTIVFDILESSSNPDTIKDNFVCMVASEYLMSLGHRSDVHCPICQSRCKELVLSSRSLRFVSRSKVQNEAINHAIQEVSTWNLFIFGPSNDDGNNTRDLDRSMKRWLWLHENVGATIFISDHVQQYLHQGHSVLDDYTKQQIVVPTLSTFVGNYPGTVVMAVSQLSLGTRKDKEGRQYATGGAQMAAEANVVFQSEYNEDTPAIVGLKIVESRYSGKLTVYAKIDPTSGVIYGDMSTSKPYNERAMTDKEKEESPFATI